MFGKKGQEVKEEESLEIKKLREEDLEQASGGSLKNAYRSKTTDITESMKKRV